jgi:hypothetical protein
MRDSSAFRTRFYVGLPAQQTARATGLFGLGGITGLTSLVAQIKVLVPGGLGGIMLSDGAQGLGIGVDGLSLLARVKAALSALL